MLENISEFKLKDIEERSSIFIIGGRGTGKTHIIKNYLCLNHDKIDVPLVFSRYDEEYSNIVPNQLIYDNYDIDIQKDFINNQRYEKKHSVIVYDDNIGIGTKNSIKYNIDMNYRSYNFSTITTIQIPNDISLSFRDYLIVCNIQTIPRKKFFYNNFWDDRYGSFDDFVKLYNKITKNKYTHMLIRNNNGIKTSLNKYVYWIKCPKFFEEKKVGNYILWGSKEFKYPEERKFDLN